MGLKQYIIILYNISLKSSKLYTKTSKFHHSNNTSSFYTIYHSNHQNYIQKHQNSITKTIHHHSIQYITQIIKIIYKNIKIPSLKQYIIILYNILLKSSKLYTKTSKLHHSNSTSSFYTIHHSNHQNYIQKLQNSITQTIHHHSIQHITQI